MAEVTRMCIGCRERRPQADLLRLRRRPDGVVVWAGFRPSGRSAYLCPTRPCVERAEKRRAFSRAFRGLSIKGNPSETVIQARSALTLALDKKRGTSAQTSVGLLRFEALACRLNDVVDSSRDTSTHPKGGPSHG